MEICLTAFGFIIAFLMWRQTVMIRLMITTRQDLAELCSFVAKGQKLKTEGAGLMAQLSARLQALEREVEQRARLN